MEIKVNFATFILTPVTVVTKEPKSQCKAVFQKRNDFNNINVKNTTLSGAEKFSCKKCKNLCASLTQI
jgi:hypothetical protein